MQRNGTQLYETDLDKDTPRARTDFRDLWLLISLEQATTEKAAESAVCT